MEPVAPGRPLGLYGEVIARLVRNYEDLSLLARDPKLGSPELVDEIERDRKTLEEGRLTVVVVGDFNTGKSTLINALIEKGWEVCPVDSTPKTSTVCRIQHARDGQESFRAQGEGVPAGPHPLKPDLLKDFVARGGRWTGNVEVIDAFVDGSGTALEHGLVFVDTPGLRSVFDRHDEITLNYLSQADAVIVVFHVTQAFRQDERNLLAAHPDIANGPTTFYVLNQIDLCPEDVGNVQSFVEEELGKLNVQLNPPGSDRLPQLFAVSARQAYRHGNRGASPDAVHLAKSGFGEFRECLFRSLVANRGLLNAGRAFRHQTAVVDRFARQVEGFQAILAVLRNNREQWLATWERQRRARDVLPDRREAIVAGVWEAAEARHAALDARLDEFVAALEEGILAKVREAPGLDNCASILPVEISLRCEAWRQATEAETREALRDAAAKAEDALREYGENVSLARRTGIDLPIQDEARLGADAFGLAPGGYLYPASGGAVAGAGVGFFVGGPIGAAVGCSLGALLGLVGRRVAKGLDWRREVTERVLAWTSGQLRPAIARAAHAWVDQVFQELGASVNEVAATLAQASQGQSQALEHILRANLQQVEIERIVAVCREPLLRARNDLRDVAVRLREAGGLPEARE